MRHSRGAVERSMEYTRLQHHASASVGVRICPREFTRLEACSEEVEERLAGRAGWPCPAVRCENHEPDLKPYTYASTTVGSGENDLKPRWQDPVVVACILAV